MEIVLAGLLACVQIACGAAPDHEPTGTTGWVGTIVEEGKVTTVRTTAGSVWGGVATLAVEASIGVAEGEDEYLLGRIGGIWATDDEILVLDTQVPAIRVYDYQGVYRRQIGSGGEGPGEYADPQYISGNPQGRILVADYATRRISLFAHDGNYLTAWPMGNVFCCIGPMVITGDATAYLQVIPPDPAAGPMEIALQAHGPDGAFGPVLEKPKFELPDHKFRYKERRVDTPFAPTIAWELARSGEIIAGVSHQYRFEIRRPDGTVTVVERDYEPVPIESDEREWYRRRIMSIFRRGAPGWIWDGTEMPQFKPAFTRFLPTLDGTIWVVRPGPGRRLPECDPAADIDDHAAFQAASCWRDAEIVDVFGPDGRFLGQVDMPDDVNLRFALPWIKGDTVIANFYDESDTIQVVRYRLIKPEGQTQP